MNHLNPLMHDLDSASVQRAIVQQLEGFRRAGLTHWTKIAPLPVETLVFDAARGPVDDDLPIRHRRGADALR